MCWIRRSSSNINFSVLSTGFESLLTVSLKIIAHCPLFSSVLFSSSSEQLNVSIASNKMATIFILSYFNRNPLLLKRLLAGLITLFSILNCAFVVSSVSSSFGG